MDSVRTAGFTMQPAHWECSASLRYFPGARHFAAGVAEVLGGPLPDTLQAVRHGASGPASPVVLAWRSPTETLLLCSAPLLAAIGTFCLGRNDLCVIDQTGGIRAWTLTGPRVGDVLVRLGSPSIIPTAGAARVGRLAELTALVCDVDPDETLLLIDRVYEQHLLAWVRETAADLT